MRVLYPRSREFGMDPAALQVLLCLWLEDDRTVGSLAEQLVLRPQSTSNALRQLQRAGLVEERADPDDRRRRSQLLTGRGRETARELIRSRQALLQPESL